MMFTRLIIIALIVSYPMTQAAGQSDDLLASIPDMVNAGDYDQIIDLLESEIAAPDTGGVIVSAYLGAYLHSGRLADGIHAAQRIVRGSPTDAFGHFMYARLLQETGKYAAAIDAYRESGRLRRNFWVNAIEYADLLQRVGNTRDVEQIASTIVSAYKQGYFKTAATLTVAGRAAAMVGDYHVANNAFRAAYDVDNKNVENLFHWATVFRDKYNDADAKRTFNEAIEINKQRSDLVTGLAQTSLGFAARQDLSREALALNENDYKAIGILASVRLLDGDYQAASDLVERGRAINQKDLQLLGHAAAISILRDDTTTAASLEREAFAVTRTPVDFFVTAAEDLALRFRYDKALDFSLKAVNASPSDPKALAAAGSSSLRLGNPGEAKRYLERAYEIDQFNLFVGNMLTLIDEFDSFSTLESSNFELILPAAERDLLGPIILREAESAYDALRHNYQYQPAGKIRIEAYDDADDFAVRIAGIPHLGLLGVAFGDVVAINTPKAQSGREYNWVRTLWHEIAHSMAIGVSNRRVPRWFTEGISVYEERKARPEWGREMNLQFFSALEQDRLHHVSEMDKGFSRPEFPGQVLLSYFHASKIISYLNEQHGSDATYRILVHLSEGLAIDEALESVTGVGIETLNDRMFATFQSERESYQRVLRGMPNLLADDGAPTLSDPTSGGDNAFLVELRSGYDALRANNDTRAERHFLKALELYPEYADAGSAYQGLAQIYRNTGNEDKLVQILEQYLSVSDYGVNEALELAGLLLKRGQTDAAIRMQQRSLHVAPYNVDSRRTLAKWYRLKGDAALEVQERRAVVALAPVDKARAFFELATALYDSRELDSAKRAVLQSLEIAPGFRDAQKLLLLCVEGTN